MALRKLRHRPDLTRAVVREITLSADAWMRECTEWILVTMSRRTRRAARSSAARCRGSRTCGWCAAAAAIPTTSRCRGRPLRCSCARRTPMRDRAHRHGGRARASRRARGAHRRRLCRRRSPRHGAFSQSGRCDRHQAFRASCPRRSTRSWTSCNCRSRPTACAIVGEAVAMVVAESLVAARDAAEAVAVDYEVLPAVTDVAEALSAGAPAIWPAAPDNLALDSAFGDRAAVRSRDRGRPPRGRADHPQPAHRERVHGAALGHRPLRRSRRPVLADLGHARACIVSRHPLAGCLKVPQERVRVICPDVGGGLRLAHQSLSGAGRGGVGGTARRTAGEMDRRPPSRRSSPITPRATW